MRDDANLKLYVTNILAKLVFIDKTSKGKRCEARFCAASLMKIIN